MSNNKHAVLKEGSLWKVVSGERVVQRKAILYNLGRLVTFHDEDASRGQKKYFFDHKCEVSQLVQQPQHRKVRSSGSWTARTKGVNDVLDLYIFSVTWPRSWATKGYTSCEYGCESLAEAREWHDLIRESISSIKERYQLEKQMNKRIRTKGMLAGRSQADDDTTSVTSSNLAFNTARVRESGGSVGGSTVAGLDASRFASGVCDNTSSANTDVGPHASCEDYHDAVDGGGGSTSGDSDAAEHKHHERPSGGGPAASRGNLSDERWVPYKQANGVAIYHLDEPGACVGSTEGEFMVSASIRGSPAEVLRVLMQGSANTTILGPASEVELMSCSERTAIRAREVIRLVLEAPGWAGYLCAPREMLVERMLKTEEGMYVVLFHSIDESEAVCEPTPPPPYPAFSSSMGRKPSEDDRAAGPGLMQTRKLRSLYSRPVRGEVHGAYTLAPLDGHQLDSSPETLITVIIKLDLRGACGRRALTRPFADAFGWTDAFLDRILMSVILVRDEVEHSRFKLKPLSMVAADIDATVLSVEEQDDESAAYRRGRMTSSIRLDERLPSDPNAPPPGINQKSPVASNGTAAPANGKESPRDRSAPHDGLPTVNEQMDGDEGAPLDLQRIQDMCTCDKRFWESIHAPGKAAPFRVRGPTYLKDRKKIPAGLAAFTFGAMDVVTMPRPVQHVARYLPSIRQGRIPFAFIINLIIPGTPLLGIVATFITDRHPDVLGPMPRHPMEDQHDWMPFDFVLHKFLNGSAATRNLMLKLIPHIADGSWVIKQSVGTTPVITGKALQTSYHVTKQYIEIDIDVSANNVAAYVTGLVRGATKSLVIDMGFVLEGTTPWELPECLLGAIRLNYLDITKAKPLDLSREIPLARAAMPSPPPAAQADEAQGVPSTKHRKTPSFASHQFNPELLGPQLSRPSVASRSSNG